MRTTIDGIMVEVSPPTPSIKFTKSRMPGIVCRFPCECGIVELSITKEMLKSVPFHRSSATAFDQVKSSHDYTQELNAAYSPDFVAYAEKFQLIKQKWANRTKHPSYGTTMQVRCDACKRIYKIPVEFRHNVEPHAPITRIEGLKQFKLGDNRKTKVILARVGLTEGFGSWNEFKEYLLNLSKESETIYSVLDSLSKALEKTLTKNSPRTTMGERFVDALRTSLNDLHADFQIHATGRLDSLLGAIWREAIAKINEEGGETA